MAESSTPPGCVAIEAINPADGKRWEVYLRQSKIAATAKRAMGAARELAYLVPAVLQNPTAIFRGVREEGESQWLCYVGQPEAAYNYMRTDSASFLSERQRIVSFSAFQADSASPRFVSAPTASRDPPVTLPPLHLLSVAQKFEVL